MAELDYCARLVRETDKDRFLAGLFVPQPARAALFSLYAFDSEIRRIPDSVREPLAGEIRLQWWYDVISGENPEQTAGSPVASALVATINRHELPPNLLLRVVEAHRGDLYREPLPSVAALENLLADQNAGLFHAAALVLNAPDEAQHHALARHAGISFGLTRRLSAFAEEITQGRLIVPSDLQDRYRLDPDGVLAHHDTPPLRGALGDLRSLSRGHLSEAGALLAEESVSAYLPLALVRPIVNAMERSDYDPFQPLTLPQWRRQWHLWRASRNLQRALTR